MARPRIDPVQERALEAVRTARLARMQARAQAEADARNLIRDKMRAVELVESRAVRSALEAGVSRRRVGIEGLGTSDYNTVTKVLALTEPETQALAAVQDARVRTVSPDERASIQPAHMVEIPADAVVLRVDWPEIDAVRGGAVDLHGYAWHDDARDRWVLASEDDDPSGMGAGELSGQLILKNEALLARLSAVANEHSS